MHTVPVIICVSESGVGTEGAGGRAKRARGDQQGIAAFRGSWRRRHRSWSSQSSSSARCGAAARRFETPQRSWLHGAPGRVLRAHTGLTTPGAGSPGCPGDPPNQLWLREPASDRPHEAHPRRPRWTLQSKAGQPGRPRMVHELAFERMPTSPHAWPGTPMASARLGVIGTSADAGSRSVIHAGPRRRIAPRRDRGALPSRSPPCLRGTPAPEPAPGLDRE